MLKKHVNTIVIVVLLILWIGYPKSVMASEKMEPIFQNEELFNIKASDVNWTEGGKIDSEPGHWQPMEEDESDKINPSYSIKSTISRYGGFKHINAEAIAAFVVIGIDEDLLYSVTCPNLAIAKKTMYSNYFSEYTEESIGVRDCSDKGYSQLYYGKGKGNKDGYSESTEIFYGKAKGYFIAVNYTSMMEKGDSISEEWFTNMFYSWLDKIPSNQETYTTNILNSSSFKVANIIVVSLVVIAGVTIGIILIKQKAQKRKNQSNNSILQIGGIPDNLQGIDNQSKYCTSCGCKTESDSKYCNSCGAKLD